MEIFTSNEKNLNYLTEKIESEELKIFSFKIANKEAVVFYLDSMTEKELIGEYIVKPLISLEKFEGVKEVSERVLLPDAKQVSSMEEVISSLLSGNAFLVIDGEKEGVIIGSVKYDLRSISEPPTSNVLKGPREGFTESVKINVSLVRRRIKNEDLKVEYLTVGRFSKTKVALTYISSIANGEIVDRIRSKIENISIDYIPDSSYILKMISEHKTSLFKQAGTTEKPDILCAKIMEGRIGIIVDGSPICITLPYLFIEDFQSSGDYYQNTYHSNMARFLRITAVTASILLPSMFVSAQLFHLQLIPLNFLLTIINSIKGIPLSPSFEMFFTLIIFEILNEASIRMPRYVGMAMSVVGALVLGETAVNAGIVSTPAIMIMALSGIGLYTVPELINPLSLLRLVFLIVAGSIGGYGIILLSCAFLVYLCGLESYGVSCLSPYAPLIKEDLKDGIYMDFLPQMKKRPEALKPKNKVRMKKNEK